jgi:glucose-6-phosphate-specific signal transduction histidine kinase
MRSEATRDGLLRYGVIAIGYGLLFAGLHAISFSHWAVFNGLRLAALLLLPYRYWPVVILGEAVPLTYDSIMCLDQSGVAWSVLHAVPGCLIVMPAVYWCRQKLIHKQHDSVQISDILLCALLASVLLTGWNFVTLSVTKPLPGFQMPPYEVIAARWVIGNYLGILTVCPMILAVWDVLNHATPRALAARIVRSRFVLECLGLAAPIACAAVLYASHVPSEQQVAQIMMIVPVVALAIRHGWRGAAAGGFLASTAIIVMMPLLYDHDTLQAETLIAFVMSTMLILGARITALSARLDLEQKASGAGNWRAFEDCSAALNLQTPPDAVMSALLTAADAVLERHTNPKPWQVLVATLQECRHALRDAWLVSRHNIALQKSERPSH